MSDTDSDAPEEFTYQQGNEQHQEITRLEQENKARVAREAKERRRKWAQKSKPKSPGEEGSIDDVKETEESIEDAKEETEARKRSLKNLGFLPADIVKQLAAREKCEKHTSDPEEDEEQPKKKSTSEKERGGLLQAVVIGELPPPHCLQSSLDFLKKRKMQVSRSSAVLNNSDQALRLISTSGSLSRK